MKKILSLLALVLMSCMGAWAGVVTSITPCTDTPDYVYTIKMCHRDYYWDANTKPVASTSAGQFAFFKVDGKDDTYYIFSVDGNGWVTYNKVATPSDNTKNFVSSELAQDKANANYFKIIYVTGNSNNNGNANGYSGFNIIPYTSADVPATDVYLNYNGGVDDYGDNPIGTWRQGNNDRGSIWHFYGDEPYGIGFANTTHTNSSRQISSIKLGEQQIDINGAGNVFQDLTETASFTINVGEDVKPAIIWNGSWMHGYVYVDTDASDKQFTVEELVSSAPMPNPERNVNLATEFNTFHIDNAGDYRMRYKVEWNHTDPLGNGGSLINNGGYVLDVMLHVVEPEEILTFNYTSTSGATWSVQKYVEANHSVVESDYAVDFYNNYQISGGENNIYTVTCDDNFPFTVGVATRIQSRGSGHQDMDFYNGVTYPQYGTNGFDPNTNLWVFEHVANSADLFTVKNVATGKYLTFQSGNRQIGSLVETASISGENTSQMRVRKSTYASAPEGAFCLQHPTVVACCYGPHINDTGYGDPVNNGLGGWAAGSEEAALSNNQNCLIAIAPTSYVTNLAAASSEGNYGSIYLPYTMTLPEGVEAYTAAKDGEVLKLTKVGEFGTVIPAGAYILYSEEASSANLALGEAATTTADDNGLTGKFEAGVALPTGSNYVLNKMNNEVGFYKYSKNTYPVAKAVLCAGSSASKAAIAFDFDDVVTAIDAIHNNNSQAEIFDLQGRRLNKAQQGMNIINGHKVLVK